MIKVLKWDKASCKFVDLCMCQMFGSKNDTVYVKRITSLRKRFNNHKISGYRYDRGHGGIPGEQLNAQMVQDTRDCKTLAENN